jgi:oxepin-CoA hydrolase / 3-oxo-5,6-dehydrosuberyl-CoA semialdehyde dehydrogenase
VVRTLGSYLAGRWVGPDGDDVVTLRDAVTADVVATAAASPADTAAAVAYAREVGGPALRALTFHERAMMLKALVAELNQHREELYALSAATGATRKDAWIDVDGGIGVLAVMSSKARRELPNARHVVDGELERLSRDGSFAGLHLQVPREGVDVQINAFNFPCWGSLEKLAPAFIAGVPTIVKPATPTAFVAEALYRRIVDTGILPEGSVQLLCAPPGDLLDHLGGQDSVSFTGSSSTAALLRAHPAVTDGSVRFNAETDSLNAAVLGPPEASDDGDLDRYVGEIVSELVTKVGQRCTAIRRAFVPEERLDEVAARLDERLRALRIGDPRQEGIEVGPLVSTDQRDELARALEQLATGCLPVAGGDGVDLGAADPRGAFLAPTVLRLQDRDFGGVHEIEAFGPVTTLIGYRDTDDLLAQTRRGGGSLVTSVFASDPGFVTDVTLGLAPDHGRVLVVDERCADAQTGHGSPLPHLVHGGPGRAGGGEELGGVRAIVHHLHRIAVQGSPDALTAVAGEYQTGAARREDRGHPFRRHLEDLQVGDAIVTDEREITADDIERFAELTGDRFYAHFDAEAAAASPFFDGPVAHGYLVLSAAAGLFVWPDPGPVLANMGLDRLRFATPVYPGDTIRVALTCKRISERIGAGYGDVTWDAEVTNQDGEVVASYDLLTAVATREGPPPDGA